MAGPRRIVCMTEETTETLYLLGEEERICGISVYTKRPARAAEEKPKVSHFINADIEAILALEPDLVLGFSDLQADICAELIKAGIEVYCLNHRSIDGIIEMVGKLSRLVDAAAKGEELQGRLRKSLDDAKREAEAFKRRPRVFFEEWPDPVITGIRWVSELIEIAGGDDCFAELKDEPLAKDRITTPEEILVREPDIYLGCWCGRKFNPKTVLMRPGFAGVPFTQAGRMMELPSEVMLQPGPAAILDGLPLLQKIFTEFQNWE